MRIIFVLVSGFLFDTVLAQQPDQRSFFSAGLFGVTKNALGSDTLVLERMNFPDTLGMNNSDAAAEAKFAGWTAFCRTEHFSLDGQGNVQDYMYWLDCPVGEILPELLKFKVYGSKIYVLMAYVKWGRGQHREKEYWYKIHKQKEGHLELYKTTH